MAPWYHELRSGEGGGGAVTRQEVNEALLYYIDNGIDGQFPDKSLTSLLRPDVMTAAIAADFQRRGKGDIDPVALYEDHYDVFSNAIEVAIKRVGVKKPAAGAALENLRQWINQGFTPPARESDRETRGFLMENLDAKQQAMLRGYAAALTSNVILDTIYGGAGDEAALVEKIANLEGAILAKKIEALPPNEDRGTGTFDQAFGLSLQRYYDPNSVVMDPQENITVDPRLSPEWIQEIRGRMREQIAEYLAREKGISVEMARASLIEPKEYDKERDALGPIDVNLPGGFAFMNADGKPEYYRVYPKGSTWEIQMQNEKEEWKPAPGKSGDSATVIGQRADKWFNDVTTAERNKYVGLPGINAGDDRSLGAPPLNDGTKAPPGVDQRRWDGANRRNRELILEDLMRANRDDPESGFMRWFYQTPGAEPSPKEPQKLTPYQRALRDRWSGRGAYQDK
jgi:hypothetical protein